MSPQSFVESPGWPVIEQQLDTLPVFTVANEDKQPLQYTVNGQPMAMLYADVAAAMSQLEAACKQYPDLKYDLVPIGMGRAYSLSCEGKACVVPGVTELTAAGMPEGLSAIGQELPLFGCMQMSRETEEGHTIVPLFMSAADCEAAVKEVKELRDQAEETDTNQPELEITCLSLPGVVEHLLAIADGKPAFGFVAPTRSTEHINSYVGNVDGQAVYARVVDE